MIEDRSKLLVVVDDKEGCKTALRYACAKAKVKGQPVEMLYIINPAEFNSVFAMADVMRQQKHQEVEASLKKIAEHALNCEGVTPIISIREGQMAEEIIACIEQDYAINMLLLASDTAAEANKLLPALTAELDKRLHIPLLVIPSQLTDQQISELA